MGGELSESSFVGAGLAPARLRRSPTDAGGRKGRPYGFGELLPDKKERRRGTIQRVPAARETVS